MSIGAHGERASVGRRAGRIAGAALWWVVPAVVLAAVAAYVAAATFGHANPPVVPVNGTSMRPTLQPGDLVFLRAADPKRLRKGDVIAVNVPASDQTQYHLPAHIVHRIIRIKHDQLGLVYVTKGDANAGPDVFTTHANDVIGELRYKLTGAGYPLLFFRSSQGEIFLGVAAAFVVLYFALGLFEDRRVMIEGTAMTMQMVLAETQELREAISLAPRLSERAASPTGGPADPETAATLRELVGAISEYGTHLRSHTAVMQNLAATTADLQSATSSLRQTVAERPTVARAPAGDAAFLPQGLAAQAAALGVRAREIDELLERTDRRARLRGADSAADADALDA